jgi:hypothetical protein
MQHSIAGFSSIRDARKKSVALMHGGTSLKLSEGGESPVLEAHPGSPVDISRPLLSLSSPRAVQHLYNGSKANQARSPKSPGRDEESIARDGVAVKGGSPLVGSRSESHEYEMRSSRKKSHGSQTFYIPARVPEQEEVQYAAATADNEKASPEAACEGTEMDFEFEEDNGIWISANPVNHHGSRTSLATTTTATSTAMDDKPGPSALTIDTNVASSSASMISSAISVNSTFTTNSSDIYGWEEELDRKSTLEGRHMWEKELARRLPSGGRTMGPRVRGNYGYDFQFKRGPLDGKRRSLLHRVLNLSGSRRSSTDDTIMTGGLPANDYHCPRTSA